MSYESKIVPKAALALLREAGCGASCTGACADGCSMSCESTCSGICEVGGGMSRIVPEGKLK